MQETLVLIKPDAMERNLSEVIISIYKKNGLHIKKYKKLCASKELASQHYIEHKDKPYFNELISYLTRSPIIAMVLEGDDAISKVRSINGATNPLEANEGSIRKLYALNKNENSVHASDSIESAKREIDIWFK